MPLKTSSRYPKHFFPFVGSLWHKDRWLPCTEIIYCRAYRSNITTQPKKGKPGYLPEVLHHVLHYEPPLPLGEAGGEVTGEADPHCLTGITKHRLELLSSYWSSSYITALSLVDINKQSGPHEVPDSDAADTSSITP